MQLSDPISVRLSKKVDKLVAQRAQKKGIGKATYIRMWLNEMLQKEEKRCKQATGIQS
jgi:predicted DNA binding CopG/RHH family protein